MAPANQKPSNDSDDPVVQVLQKRIRCFFIDRRNVEQANTGEALVISVYGEWGVGKTRILKGLQKIFSQRLEQKPNKKTLIIPVFFSAWRFEKEKHLIVPLVKTVQHAVMSQTKSLPDTIKTGLKDTVKKLWLGLGNLSSALVAGAKVNASLEIPKTLTSAVGLPDIAFDVEWDGATAQETWANRAAAQEKAEAEAIQQLVYRFPLEKTKTIPIYGVMLKPRRSTKCV